MNAPARYVLKDCSMDRKAKIVATIGPSSDPPEILKELITSGLDVARMNFSHGAHEEHAQRISRIRAIGQSLGRPITILQDLQGPKLRVGQLPAGELELVYGEQVTLTGSGSEYKGHNPHIPLQIPHFADAVSVGGRILFDDGNLEFQVTEIKGDQVIATVILGGRLMSHKGVNLPDAKLLVDNFTAKDRADLAFGLSVDVDVVAISFVCCAQDIEIVRHNVSQLSPDRRGLPIIAKIERPEAVKNLEDILSAADGVMVARGDLGVETSPASVPIIQKKIIQAANFYNKPVITATQMLDSMINSPRPTRAEASDVANAILDGTDAVMLSGETAIGKYPVQSISVMNSIICEAEANSGTWGSSMLLPDLNADDATSLTRAANELAHDRNVTAIAVFTRSGQTALLMSKNRPCVPILAFTPDEHTYRRLNLFWGVSPHMVPLVNSVEKMLFHVENAVINNKTVTPGSQIIIISGYPVGAFRPASLILLHTIGENIATVFEQNQ